jgi:cytidylate kinase
VITISRTLGAKGEDVGQLLAKEMGFRYADDEIIHRAAEAAGVSHDTMAQAEVTPGLIARILDAMGRMPMAGEGFAAPPVHEHAPAFEELIESVIKETAAEGNVVIVAHGASIPLAGTPGLLRVLVTAPDELRAQRTADAATMGIQQARKTVGDSDRQRREFLRRFYDVEHESSTHYDVVVNTEVLSADEAARVVLAAARA